MKKNTTTTTTTTEEEIMEVRKQTRVYLASIPARIKAKLISYGKLVANDSNIKPDHVVDYIGKFVDSTLQTVPTLKPLYAVYIANETIQKIIDNITMASYSVVLASYNMEYSLISNESVQDYLQKYLLFKFAQYYNFSDYGAIGDAIETICHAAVNEYWWRVKRENLHVAATGKVDLTYKKQKLEVGTNGKSFLESTEEDYMNGKYSGVIYGVFSDDEKIMLYEYLKQGKLKQVISSVLDMLYFFPTKQGFSDFMAMVGRSSSLKWKGDYMQVIYNPSKHNAFLEKAEKENVKTFADYIRENAPENEFTD